MHCDETQVKIGKEKIWNNFLSKYLSSQRNEQGYAGLSKAIFIFYAHVHAC